MSARLSPQQLDPLGGVTAQAFAWIFTLAAVLIAFFVPAHAVLTLRGKDPMKRQFPCPDETCWAPKKPSAKLNHYQKQFS